MTKFALLLATLGLGCSGDPGTGTVVVTANGESFIEQGIAATEFADGWSVTFDRFVVGIRGIAFGAERDDALYSVDLVRGTTALTTFASVAPRAYDDFRFAIVSIEIDGVARLDTVEKRFTWVSTAATQYRNCRLNGAGFTARADRSETVEITVHADHLFRDDLAHDAELRFDAFAAADRDGDQRITLEELAAVRLATIPAEQGRYGTGGADVDTLGAFLAAQMRSLGHFNGEGECAL